MSFLLDTDICSAHFRRPSGLSHRFVQHSGRLFISCVTLGELCTGAYHIDNPQPLLNKIDDLLADVHLIGFERLEALEFGKTRGDLLKRGISVSAADMMIAATALVHDLTLVTHNTSDFKWIPGIRLEDWLVP